MKTGLVGCGKDKLKYPSTAETLYCGSLTKKAIRYAKEHFDRFFILSAKYGLLFPGEMISPFGKKMQFLTPQKESLI